MQVNGVEMAEVWAVIATGVITPSADTVVLKTDDGKRVPIIVGMFPDQEKAARMARRFASRIGRVEQFADPSFTRCTPIYGVQKVCVPFRQPRQRPQTAAFTNTSEQAEQTGGKRRGGRRPGRA